MSTIYLRGHFNHFATTMFEAYDSPVRTMRLQPPDLSWIRRILWPALDHFVSDQGFVLAGYISFTTLFALFPFLIFLLAFAGFLGETEAARESIDLALRHIAQGSSGASSRLSLLKSCLHHMAHS